MLEERLKVFLTLVSRYRKAQTDLSRQTIVDELKSMYVSTSSATIRGRISNFLASVGAYGKTG